jgi:hypothetical protein
MSKNQHPVIFRDSRKEKRELEDKKLGEIKNIDTVRQPENIENKINDFSPIGVGLMSKESLEKRIEEANILKKIDKFSLSYIEDYEEEEAKRLIEESLGFEPFHVVGWQIAVKVFTRPEELKPFKTEDGRMVSIVIPEEARAHDKFVNCVGLVLNQGPLCYTGKYFQESIFMRIFRFLFGQFMKPSRLVPWCKIGDWVVFDRNAGPQINYRGVPITILEDKNIRGVVPDPTFVSRY